ncbi:MAG TPA: HTTM domain-containing protein [Chthoniobacterales bacterium]|jgi:hypothetical protein
MSLSPRIRAFLRPPDSGRWLTLLRIGLGWELIFYLVPLRQDWDSLLGGPEQGLFGREIGEAMTKVQSPFIPRIGWMLWFTHRLGLSDLVTLSLVWWCLLIAACLLILGIFCRPVAIVAWFLQLASAKSGGLFSYGADNFITIGLFYLMIAPLPDCWALDHVYRRFPIGNLYSLGFHRRVLQLHLCLIYFFSGLSKALGANWWNGSNLWRALTSPPYDVLPLSWVAAIGSYLPAIGISICLFETAYPFLIWWRRARYFAFYGICAMHIAIALLMGMYLFSGIMLVLNAAAFLPNDQRTNPEAQSAPPG